MYEVTCYDNLRDISHTTYPLTWMAFHIDIIVGCDLGKPKHDEKTICIYIHVALINHYHIERFLTFLCTSPVETMK